MRKSGERVTRYLDNNQVIRDQVIRDQMIRKKYVIRWRTDSVMRYLDNNQVNRWSEDNMWLGDRLTVSQGDQMTRWSGDQKMICYQVSGDQVVRKWSGVRWLTSQNVEDSWNAEMIGWIPSRSSNYTEDWSLHHNLFKQHHCVIKHCHYFKTFIAYLQSTRSLP